MQQDNDTHLVADGFTCSYHDDAGLVCGKAALNIVDVFDEIALSCDTHAAAARDEDPDIVLFECIAERTPLAVGHWLVRTVNPLAGVSWFVVADGAAAAVYAGSIPELAREWSPEEQAMLALLPPSP